MKVRIRAIPILVALHLGSSAITEEREILHLVEDAEFQNYIDSVDIVLASASRSPLHTAAERIIFFSEAGAIKDNKIDVSRMWFLGGETADFYQNLDTHNGNCFLQIHEGPSQVRVLIAVSDTSGGVTYQDKQCYLLTLAVSYGFNSDNFPNLTEAGMLVELIRSVEGTP